ncbi:hypothetical protein LCGC14_1009960 [marine sediment metagenome]|uniref:Uncharacterized protein n=1 Tax=marine sediment metagenome TaxID=412755 RepID=A0A0F9NLW8_9ZZZZ
MMLKYVEDHWLVREKVLLELDDKVIAIARAVLENGVKWHSEDDTATQEFSDLIIEFIDLNDYTFDEFDFVITWVTHYCAVAEAYHSGILKNPEDVPEDLIK